MNIVHVREYPQQLAEIGVYDKGVADSFAKAPVFLMPYPEVQLTPQEKEFCVQNFMAGENMSVPTKLPYPFFNLVVHMGELPEQKELGKDVILQVTNRPTIDDIPPAEQLLFIVRGQSQYNKWTWIACAYNGRYQDGMRIGVWRNGENWGNNIKGDTHKEDCLTALMSTSRTLVAYFLFELMTPTTVTVRVTPNKPSKSVVWHESRTHYLLLHKTQVRSMMSGKRGPSQQEIERAAHSRRAHMRRLMSEKWVNKRGQIVFVKESWVGPTEWQDTDGKIYKVMLRDKQV